MSKLERAAAELAVYKFSAGNLGRWGDGTPDCGMVPRGLVDDGHLVIPGEKIGS